MDGARELDLLQRVRLPTLSASRREDQQAVSGVRSSCDMLARNSDL